MYIKIIGLLAATLTTIAFIPQALKTLKTKSTDDISPSMFILLCSGVVLWLIYGIFNRDLPIILANTVTIFFSGIILYYVIKPQHSHKIEHIALWVNDLEAMKTFYCTHFNTQASTKYKNPKKQFESYFLTFTSGARIELMHTPNKHNTTNSGHISISLGSKSLVDTKTEQLSSLGIEIHNHTRTTGDGYYESIIKDPEGNLIELTV